MRDNNEKKEYPKLRTWCEKSFAQAWLLIRTIAQVSNLTNGPLILNEENSCVS